MWNAFAIYADGTTVEENFPYNEGGNYYAECERQHELEAWLLGQHEDCICYSVCYAED